MSTPPLIVTPFHTEDFVADLFFDSGAIDVRKLVFRVHQGNDNEPMFRRGEPRRFGVVRPLREQPFFLLRAYGPQLFPNSILHQIWVGSGLPVNRPKPRLRYITRLRGEQYRVIFERLVRGRIPRE